jgi:hypothetical protein
MAKLAIITSAKNSHTAIADQSLGAIRDYAQALLSISADRDIQDSLGSAIARLAGHIIDEADKLAVAGVQ